MEDVARAIGQQEFGKDPTPSRDGPEQDNPPDSETSQESDGLIQGSQIVATPGCREQHRIRSQLFHVLQDLEIDLLAEWILRKDRSDDRRTASRRELSDPEP